MSPLHRSARVALAATLGLLVCTGCAVPFISRIGPAGADGTATARIGRFRGWRKCVHLDNGLVHMAIVPQIGGRTLDYSLDGWNYLAIGRRELGTTLDDNPLGQYRHYGGQFAQLLPETRWRGLQSRYPADLFMGEYEARVVGEAAGPVAAVELTGPPELATGTRLVRCIELFAGSTRARITDILSNTRLVPQEWGIHGIVQFKGHATRNGVLKGKEKADGQMGLLVPLNPKSRYRGGVRQLIADRRSAGGVRGQWSTSRLPGLLELRYHRLFSKAAVDPALPWVAIVDRASDHVLIHKCSVPDKAVLTTGPAGRYPMIELQSLGPVAKLGPGKSTSLVQEWFAARCPSPVVDVTDAGVVSSPLTLLRDDGGKVWAEGTFGVFYVGKAVLVFARADGGELARVACGPVHPHRPFALKRAIELPKGTARVTLDILDDAGKCVGDLGKILLGAS